MTTNAQRDQNHVPTIISPLDSDGSTVVRVKVNPTDHGLKFNDDTTGSDNGGNSLRDENHTPVLMGISSDDGVTPVAIYANSDGELLVDSN